MNRPRMSDAVKGGADEASEAVLCPEPGYCARRFDSSRGVGEQISGEATSIGRGCADRTARNACSSEDPSPRRASSSARESGAERGWNRPCGASSSGAASSDGRGKGSTGVCGDAAPGGVHSATRASDSRPGASHPGSQGRDPSSRALPAPSEALRSPRRAGEPRSASRAAEPRKPARAMESSSQGAAAEEVRQKAPPPGALPAACEKRRRPAASVALAPTESRSR
mmetsp:Transcript_37828/g.121335  ORF Transcript_37828/g.121335 Transcript_37828/m.121335 type:complete len:226 (+) Transcript_37828:631-1308(+)